MIYLNAIWNKWGEETFHKIFDNSVIFSHEKSTHEKCMKMISQRKTLKRFLKKKEEKYISKKHKNENLFGFILRARFMMLVFQKIKIFSSIAYDSV